MNGRGWERVRMARLGGEAAVVGTRRREVADFRQVSSQTVRLGRVQPQHPSHRTIYCNDSDANSIARFKVGGPFPGSSSSFLPLSFSCIIALLGLLLNGQFRYLVIISWYKKLRFRR